MISLAIPLYDEEENVEVVARELTEAFARAGFEYELILVDNGSRDRTGELIDELARENPAVRKVVVEENQGFGWGVLSGLKEARGKIVGFMGGDRQIHADDVVRVIRLALEDSSVDLTKVVRIERHDGVERALVTFFYNLLFRVLFRCPYRDINGTPKLLRRELLEELGLSSKDWFVDAEVMLKAQSEGARIGEIEVEFFEREKGASHVRPSAIVEFLRNMLRYRFQGKKAWKTPKS